LGYRESAAKVRKYLASYYSAITQLVKPADAELRPKQGLLSLGFGK